MFSVSHHHMVPLLLYCSMGRIVQFFSVTPNLCFLPKEEEIEEEKKKEKELKKIPLQSSVKPRNTNFVSW